MPIRLRRCSFPLILAPQEQGKSVLTSSKEVLAEGRPQIMFKEPVPPLPMSPGLFVLANPV